MKLYQYQGGGYDGCIWEWNFFLIDNEGNFQNIISSGCAGIRNQEEANKLIEDIDKAKEEDIYVYDLSSTNSIEEFSKSTCSNFIGRVCNDVNTYLEKEIIFYDCSYCGRRVFPKDDDQYPSYFHDENNYSGNGGIGIVFHSHICEECYHNRCDQCNCIIHPNEEIIEKGEMFVCQHCK